jgi:hypothetical protein
VRIYDLTGDHGVVANDPWFAVRTVIANNENQPWGPTDLEPGDIDCEERITLWRGPDADGAIALAEDEAARYVDDVGGELLPFSQGYTLAGKPGRAGNLLAHPSQRNVARHIPRSLLRLRH